MAVGSVVHFDRKIGNAIAIVLEWTASSTNATVPAYTLPDNVVKAIQGLSLVLAVTFPGDTPPTAGYNVTITDAYQVDVMGGALMDRSATDTEQAAPSFPGSVGRRITDGRLTLHVSDNAVNSAYGFVALYFTN